jgi:hypothetical protein
MTGYSGFLHQLNCPSWYSWNIVESGIKHHKLTKLNKIRLSIYFSKITHLNIFSSVLWCPKNYILLPLKGFMLYLYLFVFIYVQ